MACASRACVCSRVSPGRMRQFTVASAVVGSTLSCGAALSMVVTQVVRTCALASRSLPITASSSGETVPVCAARSRAVDSGGFSRRAMSAIPSRDSGRTLAGKRSSPIRCKARESVTTGSKSVGGTDEWPPFPFTLRP